MNNDEIPAKVIGLEEDENRVDTFVKQNYHFPTDYVFTIKDKKNKIRTFVSNNHNSFAISDDKNKLIEVFTSSELYDEYGDWVITNQTKIGDNNMSLRLSKIRQKINKIKNRNLSSKKSKNFNKRNINLSDFNEIKEEIQEKLDSGETQIVFEYEWLDGIRPEMTAVIFYDKEKNEFNLVYNDLKRFEKDYEKNQPNIDDDIANEDYRSDWSEYVISTTEYELISRFSNIDDLVKFIDKEFSRVDFN